MFYGEKRATCPARPRVIPTRAIRVADNIVASCDLLLQDFADVIEFLFSDFDGILTDEALRELLQIVRWHE